MGESEADLMEIPDLPILGREEELSLISRIKAGDVEARGKLACSNLRLVILVVKGFLGRGLDLADLVQEGNVGLLKAIDRFDPSRGVRFSTFAVFWIRQTARRALDEHARTIRLPWHVIRRIGRWRSMEASHLHSEGRPPTPEEVGTALGLTPRQWEAMAHAASSCRLPPEGESDAPLPSPFPILGGELAQAMDEVLDEKEREILALRFGLDGGVPHTFGRIGEVFGVSKQRIFQVVASALARLRERLGGEDRNFPTGTSSKRRGQDAANRGAKPSP